MEEKTEAGEGRIPEGTEDTAPVGPDTETGAGAKQEPEEASALARELERVRAECAKLREEAVGAARQLEEYRKADSERRKTAAARRYLSAKGLAGEAAEIAMRGMKEEIASLEIGGEDELTGESRALLDKLLDGTFAPLRKLGTGGVRGVAVSKPPVNAGFGVRTREEILAIRDGCERRKAIAENPLAFGLD